MKAPAKTDARPKAKSVLKELELLRKLAKKPESLTETHRAELLPGLASQGSLAALELPEQGIVGMSLNTHKAIANDVVEGGYDTLNSYRIAALEKLRALGKRVDDPGRGTIDWYRDELADKTSKLARVADAIALMSSQLDEVLILAQDMAQAAGREAEFFKRRSELLRKFKPS